MEDLESLLFGLLFLAVVGFQVLKQFLAARAEQRRRLEQARSRAGMAQPQAGYEAQPRPEPRPAPIPVPVPAPAREPVPPELAGTDWGRSPEPPPAAALPLEVQQAIRHQPVRPRDAPPAAAAVRPAGRLQPPRARHHLFHSRRALRHGIVMMTVLGPCRAVQPYDKIDR